MRRRELISLIGGSAAAWPLMARAQQPDTVRRIGVLTNLSKDDPEGRTRDEAFVERLRQLGWSEGRNLRIEGQREMLLPIAGKKGKEAAKPQARSATRRKAG